MPEDIQHPEPTHSTYQPPHHPPNHPPTSTQQLITPSTSPNIQRSPRSRDHKPSNPRPNQPKHHRTIPPIHPTHKRHINTNERALRKTIPPPTRLYRPSTSIRRVDSNDYSPRESVPGPAPAPISTGASASASTAPGSPAAVLHAFWPS